MEKGGKTNAEKPVRSDFSQTKDEETWEIFRLQKHTIWWLKGYWIKGMKEVKTTLKLLACITQYTVLLLL